MKRHLKTILLQQQEYEYLKKVPSIECLPDNVLHNTKLTAALFYYAEETCPKIKNQKSLIKISKAVCYAFIIYHSVILISFIIFFPIVMSL